MDKASFFDFQYFQDFTNNDELANMNYFFIKFEK